MDIQLEKQALIKLLKETENPSVINAIKKVFQNEKKDFWNELSDVQKEAINEGERQIERGEFVSFEETMLILRK